VNHYPEAILKLIASFSTLPGIGRKTAERLALHLLHAPDQEASALAADIIELKRSVRICATCFSLSDRETCRICADRSRDHGVICVVENPADLAAIEKSRSFSGVYHVLGGALSPINGIGPDDIRLSELFLRADPQTVREIIIATRTNVEGEATAAYIQERLKSRGLTLTRIASGVPMGGDLQYVDPLTLQKAMEKRYDV
jgi:recombination protein RecR